MKKLISFILILLIVLSLFSINISADNMVYFKKYDIYVNLNEDFKYQNFYCHFKEDYIYDKDGKIKYNGINVVLYNIDLKPNQTTLNIPETVEFNGKTLQVDEFCLLDVPGAFTASPLIITKNIKVLNIPKTLKRIDILSAYSVPVYEKLEKIKFDTNSPITYLDSFYYTPKLKSLILPKNIKTVIGFNKSRLKTLKLGNKLEYIEGFKNNSTIKSISFPSKTKTIIGFDNSKNLKNVSIPKTVKNIKGFKNCNKLKLKISKYNKKYSSINGCLYNKKKTTIYTYNGTKKSVFLLKTIKRIGSNAFSNHKEITKITIKSKKIPSINKNAFKNTRKGIKFYVLNKNNSNKLKKNLKNSGAKKYKVYILKNKK